MAVAIRAGAFLAGLALGTVFFAGLRWTVDRLGRFRRPGLSFAVSLAVRLAVLLGGVLLIVRGGDPVAGLLCLAGILAARLFVVPWLARRRPAGALRYGGGRAVEKP